MPGVHLPDRVDQFNDTTDGAELALLGAMLRQALLDAASPDKARQDDINRFLSQQGIEYWAATLGLGDGFTEAMHRAIAQRQARVVRRRPGGGDHPARYL